MTDDLERRLRKLRAFLNGEAPLYGHWFGVSVPSVEGRLCAFWWRQHLTCMTEAADEIARLRAENETNLAAMLWAAEEFDEERGETPDGWFGHCRKNIVAGFSEEHCGDCTNVPQSCMKCWADHYLERARQALQEGPSHE
jgi:hypothetical protein